MSTNLEQRDELAMKMLAAWLGVPVEKVPGEWGVFNDPASMAAWKRVAVAAREHIETEQEANAISGMLAGRSA